MFAKLVAFLTTQTQSGHNFVVTLDICFLQIVQHTAALGDHFEQSPPRMIVFLVCLEMLSEFVDSLAQQSHLNLG